MTTTTTTTTTYSREKLQELLIDTITHRSPLNDIRVVFRAGADPDWTLRKGLRPLHYAAYENYHECVEYLLEQGARVNGCDDLGYTALHLAAKHGHIKSVKVLLDHGAQVNFCEDVAKDSSVCETSVALAEMSVNPLSLALENNQPDIADLLLEYGADPNQKYFLGKEINLVPLENDECLGALLRHGADPNSFSRSGITPLMKACKQQRVKAVHVLVKHGADVNVQCPPRFDQRTALHFAALAGNVEVVRLLLEAGATTTRPEDYEHAAIEFAITQDHLAVCRTFLEFGADPNEINKDRCSLLQVVVSSLGLRHQKEIIDVLLQYGADPNYSSEFFSYIAPSLTPLVEYFTYMDDYDVSVIKLFLKYGSRVSVARPTRHLKIKDPFGLLCQVRKLRPYEEILNMLLDAAQSFDLETILTESSLSNRQRELLLEAAGRPLSLRHLARLRIHDILQRPVPPKVDQLPIPPIIKRYIVYEALL